MSLAGIDRHLGQARLVTPRGNGDFLAPAPTAGVNAGRVCLHGVRLGEGVGAGGADDCGELRRVERVPLPIDNACVFSDY